MMRTEEGPELNHVSIPSSTHDFDADLVMIFFWYHVVLPQRILSRYFRTHLKMVILSNINICITWHMTGSGTTTCK